VAVVQYTFTHKQYREYRERNIHNIYYKEQKMSQGTDNVTRNRKVTRNRQCHKEQKMSQGTDNVTPILSKSKIRYKKINSAIFNSRNATTVVPPYPRVIRSKTYHGYAKPRIIPNAIYNVIFV
jgi:hypothetical protein